MIKNYIWILALLLILTAGCGEAKVTPTTTPTLNPHTTVQLPTHTPKPTTSFTPKPTIVLHPTKTTKPATTTLTPLRSITLPMIDRYPPPADPGRGAMTSVPAYDPNSNDPWQMDLRAYDLSTLDLIDSLNDLLYATFDDQTIWPPDERMPLAFDWQHIMELGKNPGLGVRSLHAQGITGRGVGIAIIDQPLLVKHQEYRERLQLYQEIKIDPTTKSHMHGAAVASIAVGKTTGVAPEADLYYIGAWVADWNVETESFDYDFTFYAQALRRILEINEQLSKKDKIRVISISTAWNPGEAGYDDMVDAVEDAKAAGMLVVCSNIKQVHGFTLQGLGRAPLNDPEAFESYEPGLFWAEEFYTSGWSSNQLLVPMDSRTMASPLGYDEFVFYRQGGLSWAIPYIAGVYTLAAQVDPTITPERFWSLAMQTGRTIELNHDGKRIALRSIIDPIALIAALQDK